VRTPDIASLQVVKIDLDSGKREPWLTWKPKDEAGVILEGTQIRMSQDGRWLVLSYRSQAGQLYSSDTLK
jgi:hypothetical protein